MVFKLGGDNFAGSVTRVEYFDFALTSLERQDVLNNVQPLSTGRTPIIAFDGYSPFGVVFSCPSRFCSLNCEVSGSASSALRRRMRIKTDASPVPKPNNSPGFGVGRGHPKSSMTLVRERWGGFDGNNNWNLKEAKRSPMTTQIKINKRVVVGVSGP